MARIMESIVRYDYRHNMKDDIAEYISERVDLDDYRYELEQGTELDTEELEQVLNDELWIEDTVTGNGSGSYTFNTALAEEFLLHNYELLAEACREFDCEIPESAEAADVTIRCYLLSECIHEVVSEIES